MTACIPKYHYIKYLYNSTSNNSLVTEGSLKLRLAECKVAQPPLDKF